MGQVAALAETNGQCHTVEHFAVVWCAAGRSLFIVGAMLGRPRLAAALATAEQPKAPATGMRSENISKASTMGIGLRISSTN